MDGKNELINKLLPSPLPSDFIKSVNTTFFLKYVL